MPDSLSNDLLASLRAVTELAYELAMKSPQLNPKVDTIIPAARALIERASLTEPATPPEMWEANRDLTLPTLHTNGTGSKMLHDGYAEAQEAVRLAIAAINRIEFNGRDYYPQGPDAFKKARDEHSKRITALELVREELLQIQTHIVDTGRGLNA